MVRYHLFVYSPRIFESNIHFVTTVTYDGPMRLSRPMPDRATWRCDDYSGDKQRNVPMINEQLPRLCPAHLPLPLTLEHLHNSNRSDDDSASIGVPLSTLVTAAARAS